MYQCSEEKKITECLDPIVVIIEYIYVLRPGAKEIEACVLYP